MLLLRELAYRGGRAKLRYLKVYRTIEYWAGVEYARYIVERLSSGGLVKIDGDYLVLSTRAQPEKPDKLMMEARRILIGGANP